MFIEEVQAKELENIFNNITAGNSLSLAKEMWEGFIIPNRQDPHQKNLLMSYYC